MYFVKKQETPDQLKSTSVTVKYTMHNEKKTFRRPIEVFMADLTSINIFKQKLSLKWQIDFDFDIAYTANDQIRVEDDTQFTEFARWIKESSPQGEVKVPFSNVLVSKTDKTYAPIVIKLVAKDSQLTDTLNQTVDVTDSVSMSASDRQGQVTNAVAQAVDCNLVKTFILRKLNAKLRQQGNPLIQTHHQLVLNGAVAEDLGKALLESLKE